MRKPQPIMKANPGNQLLGYLGKWNCGVGEGKQKESYRSSAAESTRTVPGCQVGTRTSL